MITIYKTGAVDQDGNVHILTTKVCCNNKAQLEALRGELLKKYKTVSFRYNDSSIQRKKH